MKIGKFNIEFFESIDVLPFERFNLFNKYVMLDSELGSTVFDFDKIIARINEFINKDMKDQAQKELLNLRIVYNNVLNCNNIKGLAFASLIRRINGKDVVDFGQDNLTRILSDLSKEGLDNVKLHLKNDEVKKK